MSVARLDCYKTMVMSVTVRMLCFFREWNCLTTRKPVWVFWCSLRVAPNVSEVLFYSETWCGSSFGAKMFDNYLRSTLGQTMWTLHYMATYMLGDCTLKYPFAQSCQKYPLFLLCKVVKMLIFVSTDLIVFFVQIWFLFARKVA